MEIRKKTLIIISVTIISLMVLLTLVSSFVTLRDYQTLEEKDALKNLDRAESALSENIANLDRVTRDWATWDDTYVFIQERNQDYIESNLVNETLEGLSLNCILYYNASGSLVQGKAVDLQSGEEIPVPESLLAVIRPGSTLLSNGDPTEQTKGILRLPEGTLMIASRPILTSSGDGPVRGTLLMGRYLDSGIIDHIGTLTSLSLEVIPREDPEVPPEVDSAFNEPGKENAAFIQPFSENTLAVYSVLRDVNDRPALVLRLEMPRDIYLQGQESTMNFILLILSVCLLFGIVTIFALENLALLPLATLNAKVGRLGQRGDPEARLEVKGDDELAHLGWTINRMLESLSLSQKALAEDEKRYRAVVEDQTEFICRYLPDGTHIFVNEAYCRYFGKDRSEILGHVFKPPIPEEDRERVRQHFASLSAEKPVATIEHSIVMPDGSIRWQQWTDRVILDANGEIGEYQSVGRDITDRKRVEEALFLANEKLNLLGSVTRHDLLNQLTAVQGYVQLAEEFGTDPEIRKYLSTANEVAGKMRDLIQFSRDYQNLGIHSPQWHIVQETILSAAVTLSLGRVSLQVDLNGLEIYADPLLEKVFYNLIENALRHGEKVTAVRFGWRMADDGLIITCEDNGIGVPLHEKNLIFRKGYGKNTGLGLFLIREILSITGMEIRETGTYGEGARFEILIPRGSYRFPSGGPAVENRK